MRNDYEIQGDVIAIELRRMGRSSLTALVDSAVLDELLPLDVRWYAAPRRHTTYALANVRCGQTTKPLLLHRLLLDAPSSLQVDHIDGDGLNNRRSNLRLATHSGNGLNRHHVQDRNISRYTGVTWDRKWQRWQVEINIGDTTHRRGGYADLADAIAAHKAAYAELVLPLLAQVGAEA